MSAAALTQFLIDITRGPLKEAYGTDPRGVLVASPIDEAMRIAVHQQDIAALWLAGAHPMALMYFARTSGWTNERYYRCITDAETTKGAAVEGASTARPAPTQTHRSSVPRDR